MGGWSWWKEKHEGGVADDGIHNDGDEEEIEEVESRLIILIVANNIA